MKLLRAISVRLLFGVVSLLFISLVTFGANELTHGDAATLLAGEKATPAQVERIRHNLGLDQPWPLRYVRYLGGAVHGDFGRSYYGVQEPVGDIIKRTLPITAKVALLAVVLASAIGIGLGTIAAVFERRLADAWVASLTFVCVSVPIAAVLGRLMSCFAPQNPVLHALVLLTGPALLIGAAAFPKRFPDRMVLGFSTLLITMPNFVLAPILVYVFCLQLDYLPQTWSEPLQAPQWMYLILPVAILAARPAALITRLTRTSMIDTLQMEFIRTAVAKGIPLWRLVFKHGLRNAILPVITAIGTSFGFLLTGSFVVERFFTLPGIGSATIEAIQESNMPVVQACILVTGAMFIILNLIVDILLPILDPRIRESQI